MPEQNNENKAPVSEIFTYHPMEGKLPPLKIQVQKVETDRPEKKDKD